MENILQYTHVLQAEDFTVRLSTEEDARDGWQSITIDLRIDIQEGNLHIDAKQIWLSVGDIQQFIDYITTHIEALRFDLGFSSPTYIPIERGIKFELRGGRLISSRQPVKGVCTIVFFVESLVAREGRGVRSMYVGAESEIEIDRLRAFCEWLSQWI